MIEFARWLLSARRVWTADSESGVFIEIKRKPKESEYRLSEVQRYKGTGLISVQKKEKIGRVSGFVNENHIAETTRQVATTRTLGSHANGMCVSKTEKLKELNV